MIVGHDLRMAERVGLLDARLLELGRRFIGRLGIEIVIIVERMASQVDRGLRIGKSLPALLLVGVLRVLTVLPGVFVQ